MGDSGQGPLLPGQVQAVKPGAGVSIALDGTLSFNAATAAGVVKTNNPSAYNAYVWPAAPVNGGQLTVDTAGNLSWLVRNPGFGLDLDGTAVKISIPFATNSTIPDIGSGPDEGMIGSLYWNSESSRLFISDGTSWLPATYGPADLNAGLLSGTYTLYVNPEIGSDEYVTGIYDGAVTPVVTNQMTVAGYSIQRPFKTIQRAALEIARLQNGAGLDALSFDRYIIKCSAGVHTIDNTPGSSTVTAWVDGTDPTLTDLKAMNSDSYAGVILPRGVSVIGEDVRKTVIRPLYVPDKSGDIDDDRGSIFRMTGGGFFFNFVFKDKEGLASSHHLLDCFSLVSDADLTDYYLKAEVLFSQSYPNTVVNPGETEIVAPQPPGIPDQTTDAVFGSSPYIFNCSVRSLYGLCGINNDGSQVTGFKSVVTAQFTGVCLQKDLYCWQKYNVGPKTWTNTIASYTDLITINPNNVRMDPARRSFHVRATDNAFVQEVSVFAIGQGVHHWVKSGGEISITNSNSTFGGCAALAEGYKTEAFLQDQNWNVGALTLATNLTDQTTVINSISLGEVDASVLDNATTIVLTQPLVDSEAYPGTPEILASKFYSFTSGSYLWIENPNGPDWRAPLTSVAWSSGSPDEIEITVPMENQDGDFPGVAGSPSLSGNRVYIRRLIDNRPISQRRYSINVTNTDSNVRTPLRDYVLQTTLGTGGGIVDLLPDSDMVLVNKAASIPIGLDPVVRKAQIVLQRANPSSAWVADTLYRKGDTVRYQNKHYTCVVRNSDTVFDTEHWSESYVHMPSDYNAYDFFINVSPVIIFNNDTDPVQPTTDCGYNLTTCWNSDPEIQTQYTTATDYRGLYQFLIGIGFTDPEVEDLLTPTTIANRELNPASNVDMQGYVPNGAADALSNWPVDFRRPSTIRMFGHAWEWSGFLNYTKALPQYQGDLSIQNQFTYYFTNQLGGRVYATGFNQEGYFVTAAGLTDLSTGETISVSDLGNPFAGIDIPTYYPQLTVDNLDVTTTMQFSAGAEVSGAPIFSAEWYTNFRAATLTLPGLITLTQLNEAFFPSGTRLAFNQAAAPTGWTQVTSAALNNSAIRLVTSAGGGTAGSSDFTTVFASRTTTGSVNSHTLSLTEIPAHSHELTDTNNTTNNYYFVENDSADGTTDGEIRLNSGGGIVRQLITKSVGSGGGHSHGFTGGSMDFAVKYADFIVAQKN
jgi:hypothetical protein